MPPKPKYSAESVIEACRKIIVEKGIDNLTAREISSTLGSTTAPIFTYFGSMDELIKQVFFSIVDECEGYLLESLKYSPTIKEFGIRWVRFAKENPNLYEFIFLLRGQTEKLAVEVKHRFALMLEPLVQSLANEYKLPVETCHRIMLKMTIFISGICVSIINGVSEYTEDKTAELIGESASAWINEAIIKTNNITFEKIYDKLMSESKKI